MEKGVLCLLPLEQHGKLGLEGVFGIRPGTSITLALKSNESKDECKIYYAEQWGLRSRKFNWLETHDYGNTKWYKIFPKDPFYFFVEKDDEGWDVYKDFVSIIDIFYINSSAIVTARDNFVIDFEKSSLEVKIRIFLDSIIVV